MTVKKPPPPPRTREVAGSSRLSLLWYFVAGAHLRMANPQVDEWVGGNDHTGSELGGQETNIHVEVDA